MAVCLMAAVFATTAYAAPVAGETVKLQLTTEANLAADLPAESVTASSQWQADNFHPYFATDAIFQSGQRWASRASDNVDGPDGEERPKGDARDAGLSTAWLAVDLGEVHVINRVGIIEFGQRTRAYRILVSTDGTTWTVAHESSDPISVDNNAEAFVNNPTEAVIDFAPVRARHVMLDVREQSNDPSIWAFGVYNVGNVTLAAETPPASATPPETPPATTTPTPTPTPGTTGTTGTNRAPGTFDPITLIAFGVLTAGAGAVVIGKKRK